MFSRIRSRIKEAVFLEALRSEDLLGLGCCGGNDEYRGVRKISIRARYVKLQFSKTAFLYSDSASRELSAICRTEEICLSS